MEVILSLCIAGGLLRFNRHADNHVIFGFPHKIGNDPAESEDNGNAADGYGQIILLCHPRRESWGTSTAHIRPVV